MIEQCTSCAKPFKVVEHKLTFPGVVEAKLIICPHCWHITRRISKGWWETEALNERELNDFKQNKISGGFNSHNPSRLA